jgi:hypothetical protein
VVGGLGETVSEEIDTEIAFCMTGSTYVVTASEADFTKADGSSGLSWVSFRAGCVIQRVCGVRSSGKRCVCRAFFKDACNQMMHLAMYFPKSSDAQCNLGVIFGDDLVVLDLIRG